MHIILTTESLRLFEKELRTEQKTIGFVPTMGSLHDGHLSLIAKARENADAVVCSIFVNPTQFTDQRDFETYPDQLDSDLALLEAHGCHAAFVPTVDIIYPNGLIKEDYDPGLLGQVMEAKHRPGHFNGVIQVVRRLFECVNPDIAVFGEKDFQQLAVIRWMVKTFDSPVKIIGSPIIRDPDGLALSSRNILMSAEDRITALNLSRALNAIVKRPKNQSLIEAIDAQIHRLKGVSNLDLEYLEAADINTFEPLKSVDNPVNARLFIAAKVSKTRLIDNMLLI